MLNQSELLLQGFVIVTTLVGFNKINCVDFLESVAGRDSGVGQQT